METILMTLERMLEKPVVVQGHLQDVGWIIKGSEADGAGDFTMLVSNYLCYLSEFRYLTSKIYQDM